MRLDAKDEDEYLNNAFEWTHLMSFEWMIEYVLYVS